MPEPKTIHGFWADGSCRERTFSCIQLKIVLYNGEGGDIHYTVCCQICWEFEFFCDGKYSEIIVCQLGREKLSQPINFNCMCTCTLQSAGM